MSNIKLCVFDLDGTLLNSKKEISEKTIEAIKKLSQHNIKYTIATGRIDILAKKYHKTIGSTLPIISCNGSIIRDLSDKTYYMEIIDFDTIRKLFNYFSSLKLHFLFYTEHSILVTKNNPRINFLDNYNADAKDDRFKYEILDNDIEKYSNVKFLKSLIYTDNRNQLLEIQENLKKEFKNLSIVSSDYSLLDLMPHGVNKGNALSKLCDYLNIESEDVCVFGDNFNDIEMIKYAGTSIVPENGEEEVKAIATYVTKSNDKDGIAHAIENIIFKNL